MAFARARAARMLQSSLRRSIPRVSGPGRTQLLQRRWASDGGHGHAEPSSDLPWALAALVITVPSCWYLWPDSSHADAGHHGGHGEEHGEEAEEGKGEDEPQEEEPKDEESGPIEDAKPDTDNERKEEEKKDEEKVDAEKKKDGEASKGSGQKRTGEVKKDDDSKPTKEEANDNEGAEVKKEQKDRTIRKTIPSSGQPLTSSPLEGENADEGKGSGPSMGSKQAGLSNTEAKHSINIADSPDKSKKPEGGPDTAKNSGTVPVKRHD